MSVPSRKRKRRNTECVRADEYSNGIDTRYFNFSSNRKELNRKYCFCSSNVYANSDTNLSEDYPSYDKRLRLESGAQERYTQNNNCSSAELFEEFKENLVFRYCPHEYFTFLCPACRKTDAMARFVSTIYGIKPWALLKIEWMKNNNGGVEEVQKRAEMILACPNVYQLGDGESMACPDTAHKQLLLNTLMPLPDMTSVHNFTEPESKDLEFKEGGGLHYGIQSMLNSFQHGRVAVSVTDEGTAIMDDNDSNRKWLHGLWTRQNHLVEFPEGTMVKSSIWQMSSASTGKKIVDVYHVYPAELSESALHRLKSLHPANCVMRGHATSRYFKNYSLEKYFSNEGRD